MSITSVIADELNSAQNLLNKFVSDTQSLEIIAAIAEHMVKAIKGGNKIISCGNGGSMCDAMHFAEELTGQYRDRRKAIPAIAISDPSHLSCVSNDYGYDAVFSRFIEAFAQKGDVFLAISTSGNSKNVLQALKVAKEKGTVTVGLSGHDGGKMKDLCDSCLVVPFSGYSDRIQEIHIKVIHILILLIEKGLGY